MVKSFNGSENEITTYLSMWVFPEMVVPPISTQLLIIYDHFQFLVGKPRVVGETHHFGKPRFENDSATKNSETISLSRFTFAVRRGPKNLCRLQFDRWNWLPHDLWPFFPLNQKECMREKICLSLYIIQHKTIKHSNQYQKTKDADALIIWVFLYFGKSHKLHPLTSMVFVYLSPCLAPPSWQYVSWPRSLCASCCCSWALASYCPPTCPLCK